MIKADFSEQIIWKVTGDCNLRCTYCHFFADPKVDEYPQRVSELVQAQVLLRLEEHIAKTGADKIALHYEGGEPLLLGFNRFDKLLNLVNELSERTNCKIRQSMTTNGTLLNDGWIKLLEENDVGVTISIDGPTENFNRRRIYQNGRGSFEKVKNGLFLVKSSRIRLGCLVVADPTSDPDELLAGMVEGLGLKSFDVLIPKINYDQKERGHYLPIGRFFADLFHTWYSKYSYRGIKIRICTDLVALLLGKTDYATTVSGGRMTHLLIESNGDLQTLYNFGYLLDAESVQPNVFTDTLFDITQCRDWQAARIAIERLPFGCEDCRYVRECRGGIPYTRYSSSNGFGNPTLYCEDIQFLFDSVIREIEADLVPLHSVCEKH